MFQFIIAALLTIVLSSSASRLGVEARKKLEHKEAYVLAVQLEFNSADSSDDITADVLKSICAHIIKHSFYEGILDKEGVNCQHRVFGFPVKVRGLPQLQQDIFTV